MGYDFYLDKMLLSITPSKLERIIRNKNKTYDAITKSIKNSVAKMQREYNKNKKL